MNWEAVAAIGELLGATGVIVSLLYLAVQVRQNTRQTRLAAQQAVSRSSESLFGPRPRTASGRSFYPAAWMISGASTRWRECSS
jgi:hypothetical protein